MASEIKKLIAMPELKLDGHVHVVSNPRNHLVNKLREPWAWNRSLPQLLGRMSRAGINAVALTNAGDDLLYERYAIQARDLPDNYWTLREEYLIQIIPPGDVPLLLIKAQELFLPEGHLLLWGLGFSEDFQKNSPTLENVLGIIQRRPGITAIADHPFYGSGLGAKGNLYRCRQKIDAYEENGLASNLANQKAENQALIDEKPIVSNSDAHMPWNIGSRYNNFAGLDYLGDKDFLISLRHAVKQNSFTRHKKQGLLAKAKGAIEQAHHAGMVLSDHKLRLSRLACARDNYTKQFPAILRNLIF